MVVALKTPAPCAEDKTINPLQQRRAGVLLHPSSLPSGKLTKAEVARWLEFMQNSGLTVWQILPLVIPDDTGSPYQSCSAFALHTELFELDGLSASFSEVDDFIDANPWLDDFVLFRLLQEQHLGLQWQRWPEAMRNRDAEALQKLRDDYADRYYALAEAQVLAHQQWLEIRQQAHAMGIYLFGDIPIFVSLNSSDVWANPKEFLLNEHGYPEYIAGVPPDYFSATGQRWGNPHYNWQYMLDNDFSWWKQRVKRQFDCFDIVRIDHFRGLQAVWMIESRSDTAIDGYWQETPGEELMQCLQDDFADLAIVAEDLGVITPEVVALKQQFQLPGMSVLQFSFDYHDDNPHKPENIETACVVYTGTHDNDTSNGFYLDIAGEQRQLLHQRMNLPDPIDNFAWRLIQTAMHSKANTMIAPLQDYLGLGNEARMNVPGQTEGNWLWQMDWSAITPELENQILQEVTHCERKHDA